MSDKTELNHDLKREDFEAIKDTVMPQDGWGGDDWDYALCEAAINFWNRRATTGKTELNLEAERVRFEAATDYAPEQYDFDSATGGYELDWMQHIFMGWIAARRATIQPTAAEPVYQVRIHADNGHWTDITEAEVGMWKSDGFTVRTLYTGPVAPADAVRDAERLNKFIDWYLREGARSEVHTYAYIVPTTREIILQWLDAPTQKEPAK